MGIAMPELLSSIDQIDSRWLASVFAPAGIDVPAISSFRVAPLGAGNTGTTVKVSLEYEVSGAAAPASVVCKFHPDDQAKIEAIKSAGVFLTETNVQKLLAEHCEAAIPECYFVAVADDGGQFNMVSEDLSEKCELGDQINGCSIVEARAAILELARLHRQFWNEPRLNDLEWIRPRMPFPENGLELLDDRLCQLLTEEQHDVVKQAAPRIYDWLALEPDNQTLIHVDCRVDNLLFDQNNSTSPQAYLIDFALVSVGDAVADVAYFLTSSLSPEDRLACEADLLDMHTREIARKDPAYTIEKAMASYRENIVSSLYLTMVAAMGVPDAPHKRLLLRRLFERNCAALQHWMDL
ncbi:MAG: phosphotransferase [Gammaproteobacteria bacterium]|nr:phosphotransferase [Gammaproteobacteria bacterium]